MVEGTARTVRCLTVVSIMRSSMHVQRAALLRSVRDERGSRFARLWLVRRPSAGLRKATLIRSAPRSGPGKSSGTGRCRSKPAFDVGIGSQLRDFDEHGLPRSAGWKLFGFELAKPYAFSQLLRCLIHRLRNFLHSSLPKRFERRLSRTGCRQPSEIIELGFQSCLFTRRLRRQGRRIRSVRMSVTIVRWTSRAGG
jgi:hypothetical protein